jgi:hypothetical protein
MAGIGPNDESVIRPRRIALMTLALLAPTCRYAATNFGQAKAGLPATVSGPSAP